MAGAWPTDIHKAKLIQCLESGDHRRKDVKSRPSTGAVPMKSNHLQNLFDRFSSYPVFPKLQDCEHKAMSKRKVHE